MMKFFFLPFLLFSFVANAQVPKIGSNTDLKDKLATVKPGVFSVKQSLTELKDGKRVPNFSIGQAIIEYTEDANADKLTIRFGPDNYSGSLDEYKAFYKQVKEMLDELLGKVMDAYPNDDDISWFVSYRQKFVTKEPRESVVSLNLSLDKPQVVIKFSNQNK